MWGARRRRRSGRSWPLVPRIIHTIGPWPDSMTQCRQIDDTCCPMKDAGPAGDPREHRLRDRPRLLKRRPQPTICSLQFKAPPARPRDPRGRGRVAWRRRGAARPVAAPGRCPAHRCRAPWSSATRRDRSACVACSRASTTRSARASSRPRRSPPRQAREATPAAHHADAVGCSIARTSTRSATPTPALQRTSSSAAPVDQPVDRHQGASPRRRWRQRRGDGQPLFVGKTHKELLPA